MINDVEEEIYRIASQFIFIKKAETLLKTPNTVKIKLTITPTCFLQIYQNIQKGIKSYVVISGNQRLFGRDCDGGAWHCHPIDDPDRHDFSRQGSKEVSLEELLYETGEKLILLGIL